MHESVCKCAPLLCHACKAFLSFAHGLHCSVSAVLEQLDLELERSLRLCCQCAQVMAKRWVRVGSSACAYHYNSEIASL